MSDGLLKFTIGCLSLIISAISVAKIWVHFKIPKICTNKFDDIEGDIASIKNNIKEIKRELKDDIKAIRDDTSKLKTSMEVLSASFREIAESLKDSVKRIDGYFKKDIG